MKLLSQKLIGNLLIEIGNRIKNGTCGLDDEEIKELSELLLHRKLTLEQVCNEYGISRATLYRRIQSGEFPKPRKDPGGKEYFWKDEIDLKK